MATQIPADAPALVVPEFGRIELGRRPVPHPGPGKVLVRTDFTGVSVGTEMLAATGERPAWGPVPFTPGYQGVGHIVAFGEGEERHGLTLGEPVACFADGTHGAYFVADLELTYPIEENDSYHMAALFVPAAVGLNAINKAGLKTGDTVLILGQGLIGQATALLARDRGAYVVASEVSPERRAISAAHCADRVIDGSAGSPWSQLKDDFPDGFDMVIESTGVAALIDDALQCLRFEGTMVFEGLYPDQVSFTYELAHERQINAVFPWFIGTSEVRRAVLDRIVSGTLDFDPLITNRVLWTEAANTYRRLFTAERDHLNGIVIDWRGAE
jgi:2-desacetyl-2-hydroxyethyl bacteriochlorophyllide A dehydrogenase